MMRLGVMLPSVFPTALVEMALGGAEAVSADSLWMPDHLLGTFHPEVYDDVAFSEIMPDPDAFLDPFCTCAWAARSTELPLGLAVTDGIRRAAPDVARATLTLHQLCRGGFNLGVGCGEAENIVPFGYSFDRPVAATERFLVTLRHLLDTGRMPDGPGRIGLPLQSDTGGRPRVWVAAHGPRMLRLTGQYGDGWLPVGVATPEDYRRMKAAVAAHASAAGRPEPESGHLIYCLLGESRARVIELFEAQPMAKLFALWVAPVDAWRRHGIEHPSAEDSRAYVDVIPHLLDPMRLRELAPRIPFELLEAHGVYAGNAVEIAARLRGFADAGCEHLVVFNVTGLAGGMAEAMACQTQWVALGHEVHAMGEATAPV